MRDSFEAAKAQGIVIQSSKLCGGGAKSPLWQKILANVLGIPLEIPQTEEGPGYGGAMLAMVSCGRYESVAECAAALTGVKAVISPEERLTARYEERYQVWRRIYPAMKGLFPQIATLPEEK